MSPKVEVQALQKKFEVRVLQTGISTFRVQKRLVGNTSWIETYNTDSRAAAIIEANYLFEELNYERVEIYRRTA